MALLIEPRARDLGEFSVRRVLPSSDRRMVGPFIFFDHMGPAEFPPGKGIQVRPHPHIGIATITYLFEGEIMHRDSLGFVQAIQPGAVNLMTAGRGIVHSERAGDDLDRHATLHGIQSWIALPDEQQECEPAFLHYPAQQLPEITIGDVSIRVIMGSAYNERSPVVTYSGTLYLDCSIPGGSTLQLPADSPELAVYVVSGSASIDGQDYAEGVMAVACPGRSLTLESKNDTRVMVVGGEPLGRRHIWWNFVSNSRDRIEQAKNDWKSGRFDPVPGDDEFIPLPDDKS
ncbi:MAG: pirin family protein [Woeseiaceae bacterium]|nr:pirin family protein [Woeseiaceae bacterium]